ncbi:MULTISPECIES: phosphate acyltransferase PlsX [Thermodesulfovibrio]|uniref:Phosphate acyltransferase n=2 Tax=Thermodesulfovibrio yellowstonii TaxID=28262 RepID=PLSX_THEYD|nr:MULTISPECIES: phosphate acyltransferase PlsX [Thermodesulfovibrio]B5YG77.1 RecName: Full=Phosphate acyltransferase; AltName: Full=Acyl-ACP phosphotransacylase; AltName: Full=Acyl-[acyl-carrier-protein]--phosphate acyltransferase; AltName: Full=Phosphate-acyl-ACP acyltransferase [Thermodesulfovibrio yellowstonii DSM 11347]ACI20380.1 fatty acid/phospholipid synthesis protein PlsX [Thermodesulfovibrio yellowstonii DSM 11347]GLI53135.1 phosphate acyltransferase [Thermodesulfovibrio islandicus]
MLKIAVDAMGGDFAPEVNILGAYEVVQDIEVEIILVGDEKKIKSFLPEKKETKGIISVIPADDVIQMDENISSALRRKNTSMRKAVELVKAGKADAVISAGHSGAMMALSFLLLGKLPNVERPAIATVMPCLKGHFILLDAGANVDCKPEHLVQFAFMGEAYHKALFNSQSPKIALLSIGEEGSKGNELTKEAFKLLKSSRLNFVGNIEGKDIFFGQADVVVCDGFVGNIVLKVGEGLAEALMKMLKREIADIITGKLGYMMIKPAIKSFRKKVDYSEYGGALLLGINGTSIICHGRSSAKAIKNAIKVATEMVKKQIYTRISESLNQTEERDESQNSVNRLLCS